MGADVQSVLWLDDQIQFLAPAVAKISAGNYLITTATTAIEAVTIVQASEIDLALVDVQLEGRDFDSWLHFIESVRLISPRTKFLIVTNHSDIPGHKESSLADISIVRKEDFVQDPLAELVTLSESNSSFANSNDFKVEDYKDTVPSNGLRAFRFVPGWGVFAHLSRSTLLKIFSGLPLLILAYATISNIPEGIEKAELIPPIIPIFFGYISLALSYFLTLWKCPTIIAESHNGSIFQERIYQSYLADQNTKDEINSASAHVPDKADHWRIRYYYNTANFASPRLRTVLLVSVAVGFLLISWPSLVNIGTIWTNDVAPWLDDSSAGAETNTE